MKLFRKIQHRCTSSMTDVIFHTGQQLTVGRLWISTLLIMNNSRCQSWMSDEQWAGGIDECAMKGLFIFSANESCQDWEDNLWNPSGWRCPTDGPISAQLDRKRDTSWFRFHWQSSWTTQIHKMVCAPFSLEPNRHTRMFPKSFLGSSYLSGKELTGGLKGMKLAREKQNFTADGMDPQLSLKRTSRSYFCCFQGQLVMVSVSSARHSESDVDYVLQDGWARLPTDVQG